MQDETDIIKVEINKVILAAKGKKVDIENSAIIMRVRKNHIFKNSVQLYKIFSFGDEVRGVREQSVQACQLGAETAVQDRQHQQLHSLFLHTGP